MSKKKSQSDHLFFARFLLSTLLPPPNSLPDLLEHHGRARMHGVSDGNPVGGHGRRAVRAVRGWSVWRRDGRRSVHGVCDRIVQARGSDEESSITNNCIECNDQSYSSMNKAQFWGRVAAGNRQSLLPSCMNSVRVMFSLRIPFFSACFLAPQRGHRCALVPTVSAGRILDGQRSVHLLAVPDWQVSDQQQCDRVHAVCDRFVRTDAGPDSVHLLPARAVRHRLGPDRVRAVPRRAVPIRRRCSELQSVRGRLVCRVCRHGCVLPLCFTLIFRFWKFAFRAYFRDTRCCIFATTLCVPQACVPRAARARTRRVRVSLCARSARSDATRCACVTIYCFRL